MNIMKYNPIYFSSYFFVGTFPIRTVPSIASLCQHTGLKPCYRGVVVTHNASLKIVYVPGNISHHALCFSLPKCKKGEHIFSFYVGKCLV